MSLQFMKVSAVALACASVVSAAKSYTIDDKYEGDSFFDKFDFFTERDPTFGFVKYQSAANAASTKFGSKLVDTINGQNYIGVDHTNEYNPFDPDNGRPSVRLETKKTYNHGLFLLDLAHMPASTCGTWPAFWTYSDFNYPAQGEIDILENIHENTQSLNVLHTSPGFSVAGNQKGNQQTGVQTTFNCDDTAQSSDYGSQFQNQGCAATNSDPASYGSALNAVGGGVYAMEWTSDVIRIWNFKAGTVPSDISSGKPDPSKWGLPVFTTAQGKGDIDQHFKNHKVVLDTTFCGNWAGQDFFWKQTSCYDAALYPTCSEYVAKNPSKYKDAYWLINSLKVYQLTEAVDPTTPGADKPVANEPTPAPVVSSSTTRVSISSAHFGNSSTIATPMTTSTVYSTSTGTVTKCPATVTNCPLGSLTTVTIPLYTTVCPVGSNPTPPAVPFTTSTVYTTSTGTVTKCPATVTNCPIGSVTTVTFPLYTTVGPVAGKPTPPASSAGGAPPPSGPTTIKVNQPTTCGGPGSPACPITVIKTSTTVYTYPGSPPSSVAVLTTIVLNPTKPVNGTGVAVPTGGVSGTPVILKPTSTPIIANGAGALRVGGTVVLGMVVAAFM